MILEVKIYERIIGSKERGSGFYPYAFPLVALSPNLRTSSLNLSNIPHNSGHLVIAP